MLKDTLRPAWVEVNLSNADYNIKQIKKKVGADKKIIGVVKADAYGHGAPQIAQVLLDNGVDMLAIATLSEAIVLRGAGFTCPIIMLGLTPDMYHDTILEYDITPVVSGYDNAAHLSQLAEKAGKCPEVLVAIDTGMGRIGFLPEEASVPDVVKIDQLPGIKVKGLFSHFATADEKDKTYAKGQLEKYSRFADMLESAGVKLEFRTLANSAAIMEIPAAHFDAVRPGIILYGCYPSHEVDQNELSIKPVMTVKANIVHLKKVGPGFSVSYGRKFTTERESLIGTLTLGYADGFPRNLSGKGGRVIVNGCYAPIVGNICMDQCMIDVTDVPNVKLGDEVILMGTDGEKTILADEIADKTGTINYEVTCRFALRMPRVYIE